MGSPTARHSNPICTPAHREKIPCACPNTSISSSLRLARLVNPRFFAVPTGHDVRLVASLPECCGSPASRRPGRASVSKSCPGPSIAESRRSSQKPKPRWALDARDDLRTRNAHAAQIRISSTGLRDHHGDDLCSRHERKSPRPVRSKRNKELYQARRMSRILATLPMERRDFSHLRRDVDIWRPQARPSFGAQVVFNSPRSSRESRSPTPQVVRKNVSASHFRPRA